MMLTLLLVLVISAVLGLGVSFILTKNDCFNIIGNDELTLTLGESYFDEGVKVVAFNKECTNITIETNLTKNSDGSYSANELGTYYIKYIANHFKYNSIFKIQKVRLITFVEPSEGASVENINVEVKPMPLKGEL